MSLHGQFEGTVVRPRWRIMADDVLAEGVELQPNLLLS